MKTISLFSILFRLPASMLAWCTVQEMPFSSSVMFFSSPVICYHLPSYCSGWVKVHPNGWGLLKISNNSPESYFKRCFNGRASKRGGRYSDDDKRWAYLILFVKFTFGLTQYLLDHIIQKNKFCRRPSSFYHPTFSASCRSLCCQHKVSLILVVSSDSWVKPLLTLIIYRLCGGCAFFYQGLSMMLCEWRSKPSALVRSRIM